MGDNNGGLEKDNKYNPHLFFKKLRTTGDTEFLPKKSKYKNSEILTRIMKKPIEETDSNQKIYFQPSINRLMTPLNKTGSREGRRLKRKLERTINLQHNDNSLNLSYDEDKKFGNNNNEKNSMKKRMNQTMGFIKTDKSNILKDTDINQSGAKETRPYYNRFDDVINNIKKTAKSCLNKKKSFCDQNLQLKDDTSAKLYRRITNNKAEI